MEQFRQWFIKRYTPLQQLMVIGFLLRLLSVFFSKGFGWSDDHFLIIESSQSWADGYFNFWLPTDEEPNRSPQGHALFYIGLHYYLFKFLNLLGVVDPQAKMWVVRLLHALWSLLLIHYGYKIAEQQANKKTAWYVGLFLCLYWFMPFISVRNLVEFVCVPPIFIAIYLLGKNKPQWKDYLIAGLWLGISFSMRFQAILVTAGIGIALLMMKTSFKHLLLLGLSFLFVVFLTQGVVDFVIWKKPFTEFMAYVDYNMANANGYGYNVWYMYPSLILGLLVPPLSIVLFAGYFYTWKKLPLLFWPAMIYLIFHMYFPNKQERFIMTPLPLLMVSGTMGAFLLYEKYGQRINRRLFRFSWTFVIVLNLVLLAVFTVSYSKRHRVEAMYYLYKKHDGGRFLIEDSNKESDYLIAPLFYYGNWFYSSGITKTFPPDSALKQYNSTPEKERPKYVVFWQAENITARVDSLKKRFPGLTYEATIEPSFIDKALYKLNPLNDNQTAFIYRIK